MKSKLLLPSYGLEIETSTPILQLFYDFETFPVQTYIFVHLHYEFRSAPIQGNPFENLTESPSRKPYSADTWETSSASSATVASLRAAASAASALAFSERSSSRGTTGADGAAHPGQRSVT